MTEAKLLWVTCTASNDDTRGPFLTREDAEKDRDERNRRADEINRARRHRFMPHVVIRRVQA